MLSSELKERDQRSDKGRQKDDLSLIENSMEYELIECKGLSRLCDVKRRQRHAMLVSFALMVYESTVWKSI